MSTKDGGPAFPGKTPISGIDQMTGKWITSDGYSSGMSLRDYFAGEALPALIAGGDALNGIRKAAAASGQDGYAVSAQVAYAYADAMLAERSK